MHLIKWNFGSLGPEQEKEFVQRRLEMFALEAGEYDRDAMTDLVTAAQEMLRQFATEHIRSRLLRHQQNLPASERMPRDELNQNAADRASSVVSLRDIQRVFSLLNFFSGLDGVVCGLDDAARRSLLLTVAVVYYLRLSPEYRTQFVETISKMPSEQYAQLKLLPVLEKAMDFILDHSDIPAGIARTTGRPCQLTSILLHFLLRTRSLSHALAHRLKGECLHDAHLRLVTNATCHYRSAWVVKDAVCQHCRWEREWRGIMRPFLP